MNKSEVAMTGGETDAKATRAKQTGMALEMDAMKKIAAQLARLTSVESKARVVRFVQDSLYDTPKPGPAYPGTNQTLGQVNTTRDDSQNVFDYKYKVGQ